MISKINLTGANAVRFQGNTNLLEKFKENLKTQDNTQVSLNGSEALANYNKPAVKTSSENLKPAENIDSMIIKNIPEPVVLKGDEAQTLTGEKILDGNGKLEALTVKGEKTSKDYIFDKESGKVESITERDNETGLPVRQDYFGSKYNTKTSATVLEFAAGTDKVAKETSFNEGKPIHITEYKDNEEKVIDNSLSDSGKLQWIESTDKKTNITASYHLDEKGGIEYVTFRDENFNPVKEYSYENGKPAEVTNYTYKPLKNSYGITPENIALKPAEPVKIPEVSSLDGEKKFRSNNTLETVITKDGSKKTEYLIDFDGKKVKEIKEYENNVQTKNIYTNDSGLLVIKEFKDGKLHKITFLNKSQKPASIMEYTGDKENNLKRTVDYAADGSYIRRYSEENHPEYGNITMEFDKDGSLISARTENRQAVTEELKD